MISEKQYRINELVRFNREQKQRENTTTQECKEAQEEIKQDIEKGDFIPYLLQEVDYLLCGNFGIGAVLAYQQLSKRSNRNAWLFNTAAMICYNCKGYVARKAWKQFLSEDKQDYINNQLERLIDYYDENPVI